MNAQAYIQAVERRRLLRQEMKRRLQKMRDAYASLSVAAGHIPTGEPTVELSADPMSQAASLTTAALALRQQIQTKDAEIASLEKELLTAREEARRAAVVGALFIGALILIALITLYFKMH